MSDGDYDLVEPSAFSTLPPMVSLAKGIKTHEKYIMKHRDMKITIEFDMEADLYDWSNGLMGVEKDNVSVSYHFMNKDLPENWALMLREIVYNSFQKIKNESNKMLLNSVRMSFWDDINSVDEFVSDYMEEEFISYTGGIEPPTKKDINEIDEYISHILEDKKLSRARPKKKMKSLKR